MIKNNCPRVAKNLLVLLIVSFVFVALISNPVRAITSQNINFQGKIVRNDTGHEGLNVVAGTPACVVDGAGNDTCDFRVSYYTAQTGGTLLLTEDFTNEEIGQYDGIFELPLGNGSVTTTSECNDGTCNDIVEVISEYDDLYIELKFAPDGSTLTETFNRMPLEASAYAIFSQRAKYAEGADDAFQLATSLGYEGTNNPTTGMIYYDSVNSELKVYDGASWEGVSGSGDALWTDAGTFTHLASTTDDLVLGASTVADATFFFDVDGSSGSYLEIDNADNSSRLFTILSNGNVGIGTDNPTAKLEVSGLTSTISNSGGPLTISTGGSNGDIFLSPNGTGAVKVETTLGIIDSTSTYYTYFQGGDQSGDIIYTLPTSSTAGVLKNDSGALSWWDIANSLLPIGEEGQMLYNDNGTWSAFSSMFWDDQNDRLGIGTTTPTANLEVAGLSSVISNSGGPLTISTGGSNGDIVLSPNGTGAVKVETTLGIIDSTSTYYTYFQGGDQSPLVDDIVYTLPTDYAGANGYVLTSATGGVLSWEEVTSGVSSVSNSDGTLTINPTTGDVVASLNLGNSNIWTGVQYFTTSTATDDRLTLSPTSYSSAARFTGTLTNMVDITEDRTWELQNNSGVIPLGTTGNTLFFTTTGATNVTLPTSGTLATIGDLPSVYWSRNATDTNLSPSTAGDDVYLPTNSILGVGYDTTAISGGVAAFNGNVGIGTTTPNDTLETSGNIRVSNSAESTTYLRMLGNSNNNMAISAYYLDQNTWNMGYLSGTTPVGMRLGVAKNSRSVNVGIGNSQFAIWDALTGSSNWSTNNKVFVVESNGDTGIGISSPTAALNLKAGTATANTAPLKFTSGTNLTTPESGAMEWDGSNLYITDTTPTRNTIAYTTDIPTSDNYEYWQIQGDTGGPTNVTEHYLVDFEGSGGISTDFTTNKLTIKTTGVLEDLSALSEVTGADQFIVSSGTGTFAYETASQARASLEATTVGSNLFTLTDPSAITFLRVNANNTVDALSASNFRTAIGAGTGDGTVTSITAGTGLTATATNPITTSGTISFDYSSTLASNPAMGVGQTIFGTTGIIFEGSSADSNETLLTVTDPTADRTITLPNAIGTVALTDDLPDVYWTRSGTELYPTTSGDDVIPNGTANLGSDSNRWADIFLSSSSIHLGSSTTDEGVISYDTTNNRLQFNTDSTTNGDIAFFTDDLYLDKSEGRVGIGTTVPLAKLDVRGITMSTPPGGTRTYENVAGYYNGNSSTGTIKICIENTPNIMLEGEINVQGYNGVVKYHVRGYTQTAGATWHYPEASYIGSGNQQSVRFANNSSGDRCILLGTTTTNWGSYLQATVDRVTIGYGTGTIGDWTISLITDESGLTNIVNPGTNTGTTTFDGNIALQNLYDTDLTNFFDGGCSSTQTMTGIDSTGAISCTSITGYYSGWTIAGDSGSTAVASGNTVTIAGGNGITTSESTRTVTIDTSATTCGADEYSYWTGSAWACRADAGAGGGLTSLNLLTAATQTFATGTSGTDFNISSVTSTHTFNIPDASTTARGMVTIGTQTFGGDKSFVGDTSTTTNIVTITGNSLTSGGVLSISSSATAFTGSLADITLSGSNAANTGSLLTLNNTGTSNAGTTFLIQHNATGTNNLAMRVNDVASDTTPFVIDEDGNVGVGTADPAVELHVMGAIRGDGGVSDDLVLQDGVGNQVFRGVRADTAWSDSVDTQWFQIGNSDDYVAFTAQNGTAATRALFRADSFQISPNVTNNIPVGLFEVSNGTSGLFNVLSSGNVGIGETSPSSLLEVNGGVELTNLYDTATTTGNNFFDGGCSSTETMTGIDSTGAISCTAITGFDNYGYWTIQGDTGGPTNVTEHYLVDFEGSGGISTDFTTNKLTIKTTGVLEDLSALSEVTGADQFIVSSGTGTFAYETASQARASLEATTVGSNLFTLTDPSAITFLRVNADNTVDALSASNFRTAIGAGTGDGTVTSITAGTGLTATATNPITTSGTISFDYLSTLTSDPAMGVGQTIFGTTGIIFEGSSADSNETLLTVTNPTADRTITLPNNTGTVPLGTGITNYVAYWTGTNTLSGEQYLATSRGGLGANVTAAGAGEIVYSTSTTAYDSLVAGSSGKILKAAGAAAPTWNDPGALTKTDDTNVTLTLGGSASTALVNAASITVGWTGQLGISRGGTNASTYTQNEFLWYNGTSIVASGYDNSSFASSTHSHNWSEITNGTGIYMDYRPNNSACTANQVLKYDLTNTRWICADDYGGTGGDDWGSQSVVSDISLTGNGTSGTPLDFNYTHTLASNPTMASGEALFGTTGLIFEGSSANDFESLLTVTDPTADRTITLPNDTGTVPLGTGITNYVAYWTGTNTLSGEQYLATSRGGLGANVTAAGAGEIVYSTSTTAYDSLVAGSSGKILKAAGAAAPTWNDPGALTKTDDTNVTLTLGGSASTALVNAASITVGWTGQLGISRGGTNASTYTQNEFLWYNGTSIVASEYSNSDFYSSWTVAGDTGSTAVASGNTVTIAGGNGISTEELTRTVTVGLTTLGSNWDAGGYEIRSSTFESDVATGTSPFTIASTTKVNNLNADLLDGLDSTDFLKTESLYYYNQDVGAIDNATPQYWILTRNAGNNDVNGQIRIDRTSANYQSAMLDIIVTSTTSAVMGGSLETNQSTQASEEYRLVTLTLTSDGNSYVAIEYSGNSYPKTVSKFSGHLRNSGGNSFTAVDSTAVSSVQALSTTNSKHIFTGNVGIGDTSPASLFTVGNNDLFQVNSSGDMVKIKNVTYSWPSANASGVLTNNGSGTLSWTGVGTLNADLTDGNGITDFTYDGSSVATVSIDAIPCGADQYSYWTGTAWLCRDDTGTTYTAGNDIDFNGTQIDIESQLDFVSTISRASSNLALQTTTSGNITLTTGAATGLVNVLTGNFKVGNGTPTVSLNGEDAYIEGTLEVDGSLRAESGLVFTGLTTGDALNTKVLALDSSNNVELLDISGMGSLWTDGGTTTYLTATGDYVAIGSSTATTSGLSVNATSYSTIELKYNNTAVVDIFSNASSNIFIGLDSGSSISTGTENIAYGYNALKNNTTGLKNTAMGHQALTSNVAKQGSTAIGYQAMYFADSTTTAGLSYNTAIGYQALTGSGTAGDNTGTANTALGYQALTGNTSGYDNTALGVNTLNANTTGYQNVAIGKNALFTNVGARYSTAVGYEAMRYANNTSSAIATSNTAIGYQALMGSSTPANNTGSGNTALGYLAAKNITSASGNIAIGPNALFNNSTGHNNIALGSLALYSNVGKRDSIAIGNDAMRYADSSTSLIYTYNTAIGHGALMGSTTAANNTGTHNTVIGHSSMTSNTSGAYNAVLGDQVLGSNTTGGFNIGIGNSVLDDNSTGSYNIAIGYASLLTNVGKEGSVAIGYQAMRYANSSTNAGTTGNTAVGYQALRGSATAANNTGTGNTVLGYQAGYAMTSGSNNTLLGYGAGDNLTTGGSNIIIGQGIDAASATGSNQLSIGDAITGNLSTGDIDILGDLGINGVSYVWPIVNASGTLTNDGSGTLTWSSSSSVTGSGTATQIAFWDSSSSITGSSNLYWDNNNNRLGIGTSTPATTLDIAGASSEISNSVGDISIIPAGDLKVTNGSMGVGTLTGGYTAKFSVIGEGITSGTTNVELYNSSETSIFSVLDNGQVTMGDDLIVTGGDIQVGSSNGKVRFNTTDSVLEFTNDGGTTWIPLGSLSKTEILAAEYAGATLVADGSSNTGAMTSDGEGSGSSYMNYYEWNSSETSLNDYDVRVRFQLPSDFDEWGSGGIELHYATESTSSSNNKVDFYVYEQTGGIDESDLTNVSSSAGVWTSTTVSGSNLGVCNAAGEVCVMMIRMYSTNDNYVRVGDIEITYDRKL